MNERVIVWREYGQTEIHPAALGFTMIMSVLLLAVPRAHAVLPVSLAACLIPVAQRVVVAGIDLSMIRLLLIVGWLRIALRGEIRSLRFNNLDIAFCTWLFFGTLIHTLREASFSALVYRLGFDFDALGTYFLFRMLLRDMGELITAIRQLAWISAIVALSMSVEWLTGKNFFSIFGGVNPDTVVRDGRLRCQGAFSHPIMAGSFGAGLAPIFLGVAMGVRRSRWVAVMGAIASTVVTLFSASSGPLLGYLAGMAGWGLWRFRRHMREIRYGVAAALVFLHFVREKPVWHLVGRAGDLIGSGTGYHRYRLIDAFVNNFGEWFLLGTYSTAHWGWGLQDVTNQYVLEGIRGGLLTLVSFIAVLVLGYKMLGRSLTAARKAARKDKRSARSSQFVLWGLGVSLSVHCTSFVSVAYFGQMQVIFYMTLAFVSTAAVSTAARYRQPRSKRSATARLERAVGVERPQPAAPGARA